MRQARRRPQNNNIGYMVKAANEAWHRFCRKYQLPKGEPPKKYLKKSS